MTLPKVSDIQRRLASLRDSHAIQWLGNSPPFKGWPATEAARKEVTRLIRARARVIGRAIRRGLKP
jgi:hypothetical protein